MADKQHPTDRGTSRGCNRGGRWCLFSRWHKEYDAGPRGELVTRNVMTCLVDMNHIPLSRHIQESTFYRDGDGPWCTAIESYGSTLDGLISGAAHWRDEDVHGRFLTGNEDFIPGDEEAYLEMEEIIDDVTRGLDPRMVTAVEDLVFNCGCRVVAVHPDVIETEEDVARDVIRMEPRFSEPRAPRNPSCPVFMHPSLVYLPSYGALLTLVKLLLMEGESGLASELVVRVKGHIRNDRGNHRKLLCDSYNQKAWDDVKRLIIRSFINKLKGGK